MKQSGVIFTATKRTPLMLLLIVFLATLSVLFFTVSNFTPHTSQKASAEATQSTVSIQNMQFMPPQITIPAGTTVVWMNQEASLAHTITSDTGLWDSGEVQPGQTFSFTFMNPGTFTYHCKIHPFMHGTIVVTGATSPNPPLMMMPPSPAVPVIIPQRVVQMRINRFLQRPFNNNVVVPQVVQRPTMPSTSSIQSVQSQTGVAGNSTISQCSSIQTNTSGTTINNCNINTNQQPMPQMQTPTQTTTMPVPQPFSSY